MHDLDFQATTYPNGKFESQTMCNENKTDGFRVYWYESGQMKSATEYKQGKPDGLLTAWHENGNQSTEVSYLDGHKHGACKLWHKDGSRRSEVNYVNGRMDGLWVAWHSTGQIKKSVLFKDGRKKSKTTWYDNGSIKSNIGYRPETSSRHHHKFSDIDYGTGSNFDFDFFEDYTSENTGLLFTVSKTDWYENGQKEFEGIYYGYDFSETVWFHNGYKHSECKCSPTEFCDYFNTLTSIWDCHGVKEYEFTLDYKASDGMQTIWRFFDNNERYVLTVTLTDQWGKFLRWEFLDQDNNKVYEYKYNCKDAEKTPKELWNIWLSSECKEFVEVLKSIEKNKSILMIDTCCF